MIRNNLIFGILIISFFFQLHAEEKVLNQKTVYYVSPEGSDFNPGTITQPLKTINTCTNKFLKSGGKCIVRGGTYRESVKVHSNTEVIVFSGQKKSEIAIVTGLDDLSEKKLIWTKSPSDSIWSADVDLLKDSSRLNKEEIQLFLDGLPAIEARWPNIENMDQIFNSNMNEFSTAKTHSRMLEDRVSGIVVDELLPSFKNLEGATIHVHGGLNWVAHTGVVSHLKKGEIKYSVDHVTQTGVSSPIPAEWGVNSGSKYYLSNALSLLDQKNEFYYDLKSKKLYVFFEEGDSPENHHFQIRMRDFAFDLNGTKNSFIEGFVIRGASISMDDLSRENVISKVYLSYVSHFSRFLGGPGGPEFLNSGLRIWGKRNRFEKSHIEYSAGNGVSLKGNDHKMIENTISHVNYAGGYGAAIHILLDNNHETNGHEIIKNKIFNVGRDGIDFIYDGVSEDKWVGGSVFKTRLAFNEIKNYGMLNQYSAGIYFCCNLRGMKKNLNGVVESRTTIDHNYIHDLSSKESRGFQYQGKEAQRGAGIIFEGQSNGFVVTHNIFHDNGSAGVLISGYDPNKAPGASFDMVINSNTFFSGQDFSVLAEGHIQSGLLSSSVSNNIFVTPPNIRTGCTKGICLGKNDFGVGGEANCYGNPGFVNGARSPFDLRLSSSKQNPCQGSAKPLWTDTSPIFTTCRTGSPCLRAVSPSFGAYNSGGFEFNFQ